MCSLFRRNRLKLTWESTGRQWWRLEPCYWLLMSWARRERSVLTCSQHAIIRSIIWFSLLTFTSSQYCFWIPQRRTMPTLPSCWSSTSLTPGCRTTSQRYGRWCTTKVSLINATTWRNLREKSWLWNGETTQQSTFWLSMLSGEASSSSPSYR